MSADDDVHSPWPDREEWTRWHDALAAAAERLRDERGIADPWHLTVDEGALLVEYGNRRLRVAGEGAELRGPEDLVEELDDWALLHRVDGPGRLLDRDRRAMAEWRERLPALQRFWDDVARHVFRDVEATTDLVPAWRIVVREDEEVFSFPRLPGDVTSGMVSVLGIVFDDEGDGDLPRLERRPLLFPQVWLESPLTHRYLPALTDEADAIGYLAGELQDDIIEEIHGAWPQCPRHPHPLDVAWTDDDRPVWQCATTPDITVDVGRLGRPDGIPS